MATVFKEEASEIISLSLLREEACRDAVRELRSVAAWVQSIPSDRVSHSHMPLDRAPVGAAAFGEAVKSSVFPAVRAYWDYDGTMSEAWAVRYEVGEELRRHVDCDGTSPDLRVLSLICYLNEDFAGGETAFPRQKLRVRPQIGKVIVFPSGLSHPHLSEPISKGTKFAIAGFLVKAR